MQEVSDTAIVRVVRAARDQRGAETLEWILIGGIIVIVGSLVYGPVGPLKTALDGTITAVSARIGAALGGS
jgi:Flp pilus assembly pilin Flp